VPPAPRRTIPTCVRETSQRLHCVYITSHSIPFHDLRARDEPAVADPQRELGVRVRVDRRVARRGDARVRAERAHGDDALESGVAAKVGP